MPLEKGTRAGRRGRGGLARGLLPGLVLGMAVAACGPGGADEAPPEGGAPAAAVRAPGLASGDATAPEVRAGRVAPGDATAPAVRPELLVSSSWLAERAGEASVAVLHVGFDPAEYAAGHIPGARFVPGSALVVERDGAANELPPVEVLDSVFEAAGVSYGTRVVLYGDPLWAARAFVTLEYLGHQGGVSLLDGGLSAWRAEGRPLERGAAPAASPGRLTPRPRPDLVVDAAWVEARRTDPGVVLLDARPPEQYLGLEAGSGVPRPGHIPGARNLYWAEALVPGQVPRLMDAGALRAWFRGAGVDPGDVVVTYCRTGVQASHLYFVARYLGYDARLYDASFADWSARPELPVERS